MDARGKRSRSNTVVRSWYPATSPGEQVWKSDSVNFASTNSDPHFISTSVRSTRPLVNRTPALQPNIGGSSASTPSKDRTVFDSATPGVQKIFIRSASELMEESSSRHFRSAFGKRSEEHTSE